MDIFIIFVLHVALQLGVLCKQAEANIFVYLVLVLIKKDSLVFFVQKYGRKLIFLYAIHSAFSESY
jgi:hypothetical protein